MSLQGFRNYDVFERTTSQRTWIKVNVYMRRHQTRFFACTTFIINFHTVAFLIGSIVMLECILPYCKSVRRLGMTDCNKTIFIGIFQSLN